jgi:hypothetical protein
MICQLRRSGMSAEAEGLAARVAPKSVESSRGLRPLPFVLSVIAECTDVISFVELGGLFTAHITGNLVILAAHVVRCEVAQVAPMLSDPVFMVGLALTRLLVGGSAAPASAAVPAARRLLSASLQGAHRPRCGKRDLSGHARRLGNQSRTCSCRSR